MLGRTHLLFAIYLSTFFESPFIWIILLITSILPDIDSTSSYLGRKFKIIGKTFEHRGFFHSVFFFVPFSILIGSYKLEYGLAVFLGMGSHLLLDVMTKQGLRIYPFRYRIRGFLKVGGFLEKTFGLLLFVLIFIRLL